MSRARDIADLSSVSARLDTVGGSEGALSNRNLIINGAMQVAQRGTSETSVSTSQYANACDRFRLNGNNGTWTISQDTDAPDGFSNSFKMLLTATETIGSTSYWAVEQKIEGQNLQGLAYGTSSAKTVTLSFYVKSNITGTYTVNLYQDDGTKNFPKTYTIDSAGTWERKTISFEGDTSTALDNDNASSLRTTFFVVAGSGYNSGTPSSRVSYSNATFAAGHTAQVDAVNDYWQITGVQLELGTEATPFEHRSFGDELIRCQRYFNRYVTSGGFTAIMPSINGGTTNARCGVPLSTKLRTTPTVTASGTNALQIRNHGSFTTLGSTSIAVGNEQQTEPNLVLLSVTVASGLTSAGINIPYLNTNAYLDFDAEL